MGNPGWPPLPSERECRENWERRRVEAERELSGYYTATAWIDRLLQRNAKEGKGIGENRGTHDSSSRGESQDGPRTPSSSYVKLLPQIVEAS